MFVLLLWLVSIFCFCSFYFFVLVFVLFVGEYNYRPHVPSIQPFLSLRDKIISSSIPCLFYIIIIYIYYIIYTL